MLLLFNDTREMAKQMYHLNVLTHEKVRHLYNREELKVLSTEGGCLKRMALRVLGTKRISLCGVWVHIDPF
jgi:hypothetical protein